ncbi:MAG: amidohydrolase [Clostridia bacterium]|nr:amidohydrolase [Clostridia bacterium]
MVCGRFRVMDAHCHIFPDKIAEKAAAATNRFYGMEGQPACSGTVAQLLAESEAAGIDRLVVHSVATKPEQVSAINAFIAAQAAAYPGRLLGLGTMHADFPEPEAEIGRFHALGLHGLKMHPDIQQTAIDDPRCLPIYRLCAREGLPVLLHTGDARYDLSNPDRLIPVLKAFPDLKVIGAHFGGYSIWEQAAEQLAGFPNLWVDCSSSLPFLTPQKAVDLIRRYGADRVLFGSDYPMWSPHRELARFLQLDLTDAEKRLILWDNAARLYGLPVEV